MRTTLRSGKSFRPATDDGIREYPPQDALESVVVETDQNDARIRASHLPRCPRCEADCTVRWGVVSNFPRYRCGSCKKTFNILTNTPLARLRNKNRWLTYVGTVLEGKSLRASASACGVSLTTAFRWHHRFMDCSAEQRSRILGAIIGAHSGAGAIRGTEEGGAAGLTWSKELLPVLLSWFL